MIRLAVIGDIGCGKSHLAKQFGYPVFNADAEVTKLYRKSKKCYKKLKKKLPYYITSFPIKKNKLTEAIMDNKNNLKKIINVVHPEIRLKMNKFVKKNKKKKFVVLDIPLLLENKIYKKDDIIIFIKAKKNEINKRLKKRYGINLKIVKKFRKLQLPIESKRRKADFIVENNFKSKFAKKNVKKVMKEILLNA